MALSDNLITYWKFDEASGNAADSVASNTLTNNNTTAYAAGKINNGADLEQSSSQSFSIADNGTLSVTGNLSFSLWFQPESQPAVDGLHVLVSKWKASGNQKSYSFFYRDNSGTKKLGMKISGDGSTEEISDVNQTLNNASFYHLVAVYTAATHKLELYVNGTNVLTDTGGFAATSLFDSNASFFVGYDDGAGGLASTYVDGLIDELGVWSKALTSAEVTELYNAGAGLPYSSIASSFKPKVIIF